VEFVVLPRQGWSAAPCVGMPVAPKLLAVVARKKVAARNATRISVSAHRGLLEGTLP
jgi:hypothetical protein